MGETDFDVVISGYGPTGQALASLLARDGHSVCVFDKWPTLYGQPRLITLDGELARVVQAAADIDFALRESAETTRYLTVNKKGDILVDIDWSDGGKKHVSGYPRRIEMYQPHVEEAMDQKARERGAEVNMGWEVVDFTADDAGVVVTAKNREDGELRTVKGRYLVGSDGAKSFVRQHLGIEREDFGFKDAWLSVDCLRKGDLPPKFDMPIVTVDPGRTHAALRIGQKRLRFEFLVNPDDDNEKFLDREYGYQFLEETYGLTADDVEIYRQVIYPFEGKLAHEWRRGRVFIAGDAAHLMPPFLGQGASSGLRDSANLAWKLDLVLRGLAGDALLDTYAEERIPHVRVHIAGSCELGKVACERDPEKAAARDAALLSGSAPPAPADPIIAAGVLFKDGAGEPVAPAGELGMQRLVSRDGIEGRLDEVVGTGFHLIGAGVDPAESLTTEQLADLERFGVKVLEIGEPGSGSAVIDIDPGYREYFEDFGVSVMLVRPDFSTFGGVASPAEVGRLVDSLIAQLESGAQQPADVAG